ncbi:MAG: AMP-binding protein [Pirellulales bacterium]
MDTLRYWARVSPDAPAYYFTDGENGPDLKITFSELDQAARAVAVTILQQAKPGDCGLLLYPPCLDFVIGLFGCLYAGCVAVPALSTASQSQGARLSGIADDCHGLCLDRGFGGQANADGKRRSVRFGWLAIDCI